MLFYQSSAPTGWARLSIDKHRLVYVNNSKGGLFGGQHDPENCSAVPDHSHSLLPRSHTHDCYHTYPSDHANTSAISYPDTGRGGTYRNDMVKDTTLHISTNSDARNIDILHLRCLQCEYEGVSAHIDDDIALTMGMIREVEDLFSIEPGTVMFFYNATAPFGWTQYFCADTFYGLMVANSGGVSAGMDNLTNITAVPSHSHLFSPNP